MINFDMHLSTKIHFGKGVISKIYEDVKDYGSKALVVYGKESVKKYGIYDKVISSLIGKNVTLIEFGGVKPNPILSHANKGISLAKENNVDMIIAIGGGSVVDEAKAIAVGAKSEKPIWDFFEKKETINDALPIIAVMTMPATSSENNEWMSLTNDNNMLKSACDSAYIVPKAAYLDPTVTYSIPIKNTAYACADILSHLLEIYFNSKETFSPIQDGIIEGIAKGIIKSMNRIIENPSDYDARASIMWAASLAWSRLPKSGVAGLKAPCHKLAHPLSGIYDVAHGASLSIVTPVWLRFVKKDIYNRILMFSRNIMDVHEKTEEETIDKGIEELVKWYKKIGTPVTLSEINIVPNIELLADHVIDGLILSNMNDFTREEIVAIFNDCI